jgi:hypothetical protein
MLCLRKQNEFHPAVVPIPNVSSFAQTQVESSIMAVIGPAFLCKLLKINGDGFLCCFVNEKAQDIVVAKVEIRSSF